MTSYLDLHAIALESLAAFPDSSIYLLLDSSGLPDLYKHLSRYSVGCLSLFDNSREESALQVAPILVLAAHDSRLRISAGFLEWLGERCQYNSSVLVISSALKCKPLQERLMARLAVELSENMEGMLRFFDTRIFESLVKVLHADQLEAFLSPAEVWKYVDRSGKLIAVNSVFALKENLPNPFVLSHDQEVALLDLSEADQVLGALRANVPKLLSRIHPKEQYDFVSQNINAAKAYKLNTLVQLMIYIVLMLREGARFVESSHWPEILGKLQKGDFGAASIYESNY